MCIEARQHLFILCWACQAPISFTTKVLLYCYAFDEMGNFFLSADVERCPTPHCVNRVAPIEFYHSPTEQSKDPCPRCQQAIDAMQGGQCLNLMADVSLWMHAADHIIAQGEQKGGFTAQEGLITPPTSPPASTNDSTAESSETPMPKSEPTDDPSLFQSPEASAFIGAPATPSASPPCLTDDNSTEGGETPKVESELDEVPRSFQWSRIPAFDEAKLGVFEVRIHRP